MSDEVDRGGRLLDDRPTVMRVWRTGLDEARAGEYERFARTRSLPMFQRQAGCLAVLFTTPARGERAVVTLWTDREAVAAFDASEDYRRTVVAIEAAGFLRPPQTVDVMTIDGGWLR